MTFHKILVANRGEIACRVLRTCKEMGYETVAVFSDADRDARFVEEADEAIHIGPSQVLLSYLSMDAIFLAAQKTGADAIHPGYGFLSENAAFAKRCEEENITFIGPSWKSIEQMGSKANARLLMKAHQIPVVPGYDGEAQDDATLLQAAKNIGFPVLLKPSFGGGGKGMRVVYEENAFLASLASSRREALAACGHAHLVIEKYVANPMHIEMQIVGDKYGEYIHCFERDCTLQRRHQKVIEESPSMALTPGLRQKMASAAIKAAQVVGYDSIGTVEFLLDGEQDFYFLEMNTRLQVEHPVTEMLLKLDLVRLQILIARGERLPLLQAQLKPSGHAIECRLYAEDPKKDFLPACGYLHDFYFEKAPYVRVDAGVRNGDQVSIDYDPLLAKIITWGQTREEANRRMKRALRKASVLGVVTNRRFLGEVLSHPKWLQGDIDTHFLERESWDLEESGKNIEKAALALTALEIVCLCQEKQVLPALLPGYRNNRWKQSEANWLFNEKVISVRYQCEDEKRFLMQIEDKIFLVVLMQNQLPDFRISIDGHVHMFRIAFQRDSEDVIAKAWVLQDGQEIVLCRQPLFREAASSENERSCVAPMPGRVLKICAVIGQSVARGEPLLILEAMKMEHTVTARTDGVILAVLVQVGQLVDVSMPLIEIDSNHA